MPDDKKTAENSGFPGHGTPGTRGTPKNDDAGEIEAALVAAAMASPSASILSLFPADRGYLARQPDRDAAAVAEPWPDEGEAGIPRRYPSAVIGLLRASRCRPVSWADPAARPSPGSWCRNCEHGRWWGDASGWRCWACHPPSGLAATDIEEVQT
jgi:hypothetical protein